MMLIENECNRVLQNSMTTALQCSYQSLKVLNCVSLKCGVA